MQQDLTQLITDAQEVHVLKDSSQPPAPPVVVTEHYRPPRERTTDKRAIGITCQDRRIRYVNFIAAANEFNSRFAAFKQAHASQSFRESFEFPLPDSDYRCKGSFESTVNKRDIDWTLIAVRIADRAGESLEQIQRRDSRFQQILATNTPDKHFIQFSVWPDSYEEFRRLREIAWNKGFEVGWVPMLSGKSEMDLGPNQKPVQ